jgi:ribonuclease BN (tRNA processing enzyme)
MTRPVNIKEKPIAAGTRLAKFSGKQLRLVSSNILALTAAVVLALTIVPGDAAAQSGQVAKAPTGTEVLLLGTASGPLLRQDRSQPSSLLIVDGRQYLIDCGIGTMQRMIQAGIRSETIGTIFITHHHPDHDLGLADVMANDYLHLDLAAKDYLKSDFAGAEHTINIYGPPQTKELVDAAFLYISVPFRVRAESSAGGNHALKSPFATHEIQSEGLIYQDDKIRVIAAENSHFALMPAHSRKRMKSYSYRIETPHGVVVFTGDTGPSEALIRLAKEADVLVSEADDSAATASFVKGLAEQNHWSPERTKQLMAHMTLEHLGLEAVGEIASKARVKSVLLYHYEPRDPAAYVAGVKKYFSGPVFAPSDLDRYCLSTQPDTRTSALSLCQKHSAVH